MHSDLPQRAAVLGGVQVGQHLTILGEAWRARAVGVEWGGVGCVQGVLYLGFGRFGVVFMMPDWQRPIPWISSTSRAHGVDGGVTAYNQLPAKAAAWGRAQAQLSPPHKPGPLPPRPPQALVKLNDGRYTPSQHSVSSSTLRQGSEQPCAGSAPTAAVLPAEQGCVAVLHIACNPGSYWRSPKTWSSSVARYSGKVREWALEAGAAAVTIGTHSLCPPHKGFSHCRLRAHAASEGTLLGHCMKRSSKEAPPI